MTLQQTQPSPQPKEHPVYEALATTPEESREMIETIRTNLSGQHFTQWDLDRITLPPQAILNWQVPTLSGEIVSTDVIEGIIIKVTTPRAYWPQGIDESGGRTPPACSSPDGIRGYGDPSGDCASCRHNVWGSGKNQSKACKEQQLLFLLRPTGIMPVLLQVPPTSLRRMLRYAMRLTSARVPIWKVYTEMRLERVEAQPFPYGIIAPVAARMVEAHLLPQLRDYIDAIDPFLAASAPYQGEENDRQENQADEVLNQDQPQGQAQQTTGEYSPSPAQGENQQAPSGPEQSPNSEENPAQERDTVQEAQQNLGAQGETHDSSWMDEPLPSREALPQAGMPMDGQQALDRELEQHLDEAQAKMEASIPPAGENPAQTGQENQPREPFVDPSW